MPAPARLFRVLVAMIAPVEGRAPLQARAGRLLLIWPSHPTHAVSVLDEATKDVLDHGYIAPDELSATIRAFCEGQVLQPVTRVRRALRRVPRSA